MTHAVYISKERIASRVRELGEEITRDYRGKPLVCVGVLKGCFVFFADLIRTIGLPLQVDLLGSSSYGDATTSSGVVKFTLDLSVAVEGHDVLLIEDIVDTGLTVKYMMRHLEMRNPRSVRLCSLLLKRANLKEEVKVDYLGFEIEDRFVVGYGLDGGGLYRNLPDISFLEQNDKQ